MSSGIETPPCAEDDAWALDADLFQLDVRMARYSKPYPVDPVIWSRPRGNVVRDAAHLADMIAMLERGDFGVARGNSTVENRWGQVMNVADDGDSAAYVVEVHDGTATDFARRVFRGLRSSDYPQGQAGPRRLHDFEVFDASTAAQVLWAFLHVGLPFGYLSTMRHLNSNELRRYGLTP